MRVLRVIDSLNPSAGGPAVSALGSAISAARAGIRTDIAVVIRPGDAQTTWWREVESRCEAEKIRLTGFPVLAASLSPRHHDPSAALARWLLRRVRGYDIVHAHSPWTGACAQASAVATLGSRPLVITPHEVFTPFDVLRGRGAIRLAKRLGVRLYARAANLIVCSSQLEMRDTQSTGFPSEKLTWIYHPVIDDLAPLTPLQPRASGRRLTVGYLGRLHPKKNVALLIDAVGQLDDRVSLVIAGRGESTLETALRHQADRVLPSRASFVGWVASSDKTKFLSSIDVLVMPSEYECFGVAAIEALAAGTPVIVSDRVGVADIVREQRAGRAVPLTVTPLADAIRAYLNDPRSLEDDASRARGAALADASYTAHGARLASLYTNLLAARR